MPTILHLNVERNRHLDNVTALIKEKSPDIVCLQEAMADDIKLISDRSGYSFAFSPLVTLRVAGSIKQLGQVILSRYPILETQRHFYNDQASEYTTIRTFDELDLTDGTRPKDRFDYGYSLLTCRLDTDKGAILTVATTHFPVTDHFMPGLGDHMIRTIKSVDDVERSTIFMDRLISIIRRQEKPFVFTADLNNPRGESIYDRLAHELTDHVPLEIKSSIDPDLHRAKKLSLLVDTIMTSEDVSVSSFEVITGVSDHKAYLATFNT